MSANHSAFRWRTSFVGALCLLILAPLSANQPFYTDVSYCDLDGDIVENDFMCFDSAEVSSGPVYVAADGWWGPSGPSWPDNPPPLPDPVASGGGGQRVEVTITEADITNDRIVVRLADGPGRLLVQAVREGGATADLFNEDIGDGEHVIGYQADALPAGKYVKVWARWLVNGTTWIAPERQTDFRLRGRWRHSQYVTVYERSCPGTPALARLLGDPSVCRFSDIQLTPAFISQTWLNGSGYSDSYGTLQLPWGCMPANGSPAWGRSFKHVTSIEGACNEPVDGNALAEGELSHAGRPLNCGQWVMLVGVGFKEIRDACPDCRNAEQLDNYKEGESSRCATREVDLGVYQTIFIP